MMRVSARGFSASLAQRLAPALLGVAGVAWVGQSECHDVAWRSSSFDESGSGHNALEDRLTRSSVQHLDVEWVFDTSTAGEVVGPIHATPVVDYAGVAYVGDMNGTFFAVDPRGRKLWSQVAYPPTPALLALFGGRQLAGTPFIGAGALSPDGTRVVFADANGTIYARDTLSGDELWTLRGLDAHPLGGMSGNALSIVEDTVLVGLSSLENYALLLNAGGVPLQCCTHRGALIALDLDTGAQRWRYDTVPPAQPLAAERAPFLLGPSGADIWAPPTYDPETGTVYIATGQNFSPDAEGHSTPTSDSIIALDFATGQPRWVHQFTEDDIWVIGVANPNPVTGKMVDADFGDAPKIYRLDGVRKVVGAGQKDGRYHVLDAATGALVSSTAHLSPPNPLGGFQTGGAVGGGLVYQHGLHSDAGMSTCQDFPCTVREGLEGRVMGLSLDGTELRWQKRLPASPTVGGLALAAGVLYFQSPVEEARPAVDPPEWGLYALRAKTGEVLKRLTFPGRAASSPVVAGGHVYLGFGNTQLRYLGADLNGGLMRLGACDE